MEHRAATVALFSHLVPGVSHDAVAETMRLLGAEAVKVLVTPDEIQKHRDVFFRYDGQVSEVESSGLSQADLCLVLGGDGTMLRTLRLLGPHGVAVAGVDLGRVSFFATMRKDHLSEDIPRLLSGNYEVHGLPGLVASVDGESFPGVNDIVAVKTAGANVVEVSFELGEVVFPSVRCDALITSTPAGSTAYNLAAGGPLLGLGLDGFVVSFVAPHSLWTRPIVVPAEECFVVQNDSAHEMVELLADGESVAVLPPGGRYTVSFVRGVAKLALFPEISLYRNFEDRFIRHPRAARGG